MLTAKSAAVSYAISASDVCSIDRMSPLIIWAVCTSAPPSTGRVFIDGLFNLASFTPGTSTADLQYLCPANATAALGAGIVLNFGAQGIQFDTGLCALIATGFALDDNTAVSANEVVVTIGWE